MPTPSKREALALEAQIAAADAAMRAGEGRSRQNRERIAARESSIDHQRRRCRDLEEEVGRYRRQSTSMSVRAGDLEQQLREIVDEMAVAEREHREVARQLGEHERGLTKLTAQSDEQRSENEHRRGAHLEQLRAASALGKPDQRAGIESGGDPRRPRARRPAIDRAGRLARRCWPPSWPKRGLPPTSWPSVAAVASANSSNCKPKSTEHRQQAAAQHETAR